MTALKVKLNPNNEILQHNMRFIKMGTNVLKQMVTRSIKRKMFIYIKGIVF